MNKPKDATQRQADVWRLFRFYDYWSKLGCIEIGYNNERQAARTDCA